jgi:hypothetical protein
MELIFNGTALAVAIAALWFCGLVIRKATSKTEQLVRDQLERYEAEVEKISQSVLKNSERVEALENTIKVLDGAHEGDMKDLGALVDAVERKA